MTNLLNGLSWQTIAVMVIGLIFVISGINSFSEYFRLSRPNAVFDGIVQSSTHHKLQDDNGNLIQYYWDLIVRYKKGNRLIQAEIKSTTQYEKDEKVSITEQNGRPIILTDYFDNRWTGISLALAGLAIIIAPIVMERFGMVPASYLICLAVFFSSAALFISYKKESTAGMTAIEGQIKDLILFQTDKEKRYLISPKHWYPLISYEVNGKTREFLSKINSEYKSSFKVGSAVTLYQDPATGHVVERKPSKLMLAFSILFFILAVVGIISTAIGM